MHQIKYRSRYAGSYLLLFFCALFPMYWVGAAEVSFSGISEASLVMLSGGVPATNLALTATPDTPAGTTSMVFVIERQGAIFRQFTSAPPYSVTLSNLPVGKYFLSAALLSPGIPPSGDLSFDIGTAPVQPPNDNWSSAAPIASLNAPVASSNTDATVESGEPTHGGQGIGKTVWWLWTAVSNGTFTATTAGSAFDTVLAVYQGTNVSSLVEVVANDDVGPSPFSQVTLLATNGGVYYFAVDSATAAASGNAHLRLVAGSPPTISITSPPDGYLMFVTSASVATNATVIASIGDPTGIARVDYWFDGGTNASRSGTLSSPYHLSLTNLFAGHYLLTLAASNNAGLISVTNTGLSVISLEPVLVMERIFSSAGKFQLGVTGFKGPKYTLQASTNLEAWCGVSTWTNFAGVAKVADTNAPRFNQRFFRALSSQ